ncbi:MAG: KH domain-containing protein [Peptoniphilaceae bacterium]|nr:KH domain-containing protein [Peptoniphilaceae bacterium]MCI6659642.1 KH domain-containing protein [Peptoniphilaceae bacterium]MDD7433577.1 KH domain-containing protein [Peptoniphilaceae bacterium]MDD7542725.1 KH domain-containing protein [Peptoniphilaceae bacterium]MDY3076042.1 KH domain-containing protein [Peptoniphilaceae bacterium]
MKDLLLSMAQSLVDHPDSIELIEDVEGGLVHLSLRVHSDDMGKVIGKQGRIANSLRQVLKACAIKENVKVNLDIESIDE